MKNEKIKYGKKNLLPGPVLPKDEKIRISILMEGDLLDALKSRAAAEEIGYQTLMKRMLRENLGQSPKGQVGADLLSRVENIEKALASLGPRKNAAKTITVRALKKNRG